MSWSPNLRLAALFLVFTAVRRAQAEDLDTFAMTIPLVGMERGRDDHTREVLAARPEMVLWHDGRTIKHPAIDHVYIIERTERDRLLIKERGLHPVRGWVSAGAVVPLKQADAYFSAAIRADGSQTFPYLMRAVLRFHLEEADLSLADLNEALRLDPRCTGALKWRAAIYAGKEKRDPAFADINRAIEMNPSDPDLLVTRATLNQKFNEKRLDLVLADIDRAIQLDPSDPSAWLFRATTSCRQHKRKEALAEFDRAVKRFRDPEVLLAAALLLTKTGEYKAAREKLTDGLNELQDRDFIYKAHLTLALLDLSQWRHFGALSELAQAISANPGKEDAYLLRAAILVNHGFGRRAMDDLNSAVRANPAYAGCYEARGSIHYQWNEYQAALNDMETAVRLTPEDALVQEHLAWILATCPDASFRKGKEAVAHATRACELSRWKSPRFVDTLAAAEAEAGEFRAAIAHEEMAIGLLPKNDYHTDTYRRTLARYKDNKPYYRLGLLEEWGIRTTHWATE